MDQQNEQQEQPKYTHQHPKKPAKSHPWRHKHPTNGNYGDVVKPSDFSGHVDGRRT